MRVAFWIWVGLVCLGLSVISEKVLAQTATDTVYTIRKLEIIGNKRTKEYIITRELDLRQNDTISSRTLKSRLERNRQRVYNTRLFVFVNITPTFDSTQVDILIEVKENWYIGGGPVFKLIDRNFNEWWNDRDRDPSRVTYGLSLVHNNFRGRMEKLKFVAETGFSKRFLVSYDIPYLDKKRQTGINIQTKYQEFKNLAYNTSADKLLFTGRLQDAIKTQWEGYVQLRRRQGFYKMHRLELSYSYDRIADTVIALNPHYHNNGNHVQRLTQLAYSYTHDTRNNINYPSNGQIFQGSVRQKGILPSDGFRSLELKVGGAYYRPLSPRWSYGLVGRFQVTFPQELPFNQLRGLGYSSEFLRGFDLYVINGTSFGLGKSNMRYKLFDRIIPLKFIPVKQFNALPLACYFNIFADAGYVGNKYTNREIQNNLSNQTLASAGVGLDIVALLNNVIRLNVSRNSLGQNQFFLNMQRDF